MRKATVKKDSDRVAKIKALKADRAISAHNLKKGRKWISRFDGSFVQLLYCHIKGQYEVDKIDNCGRIFSYTFKKATAAKSKYQELIA